MYVEFNHRKNFAIQCHEKFDYRDDLLTHLTTLVEKFEVLMTTFGCNLGLNVKPNS